jgi:hypothetical protein
VRFAPDRPGQIVEAPAERLIAARAAALRRTREVGLGLVRAKLSALRLQEAQIGG